MTISHGWIKALFTLTLAVTVAMPAFAQDGGLYEDVPDPNASFVRVVGANLTNAVVQNTAFDDLSSGVSGYVVVNQPGEISITAGIDETKVTSKRVSIIPSWLVPMGPNPWFPKTYPAARRRLW